MYCDKALEVQHFNRACKTVEVGVVDNFCNYAAPCSWLAYVLCLLA